MPSIEQAQQIFEKVVPRYDFANQILSLGLDSLWRNRLSKECTKESPRNVLDVACGTGDQLFSLRKYVQPQTQLIGVDLMPEMIDFARKKTKST